MTTEMPLITDCEQTSEQKLARLRTRILAIRKLRHHLHDQMMEILAKAGEASRDLTTAERAYEILYNRVHQ